LLEGLENLRFSIHLIFYDEVGMIYRLKYKYIVRWKSPSLRNSRISRAGTVHRSETAEFHALESSIAQESRNPSCWSSPSLRNCGIPRAGAVYRSGIAKFH